VEEELKKEARASNEAIKRALGLLVDNKRKEQLNG
jgi:hypothetical protein